MHYSDKSRNAGEFAKTRIYGITIESLWMPFNVFYA
jgi:hypothetical protein